MRLSLWCVVIGWGACHSTATYGDSLDKEGETRPLWELGLAGGAAYIPHYPAADDYHVRGLGFPYIIYRGPVLRVGEGGVARAVAIDEPLFSFDISASLAFNADSDDNDDRAGMPDIDTMVGIGPQLIIHLDRIGTNLSRHRAKTSAWDLKIQSRSLFSFGSDIARHRGFVFNTKLAYKRRDIVREGDRLQLSLSPLFATSGLHRVFYEVAPAYARANRPRYQARAGYLGTEFSVGMGIPIATSFRLFLATRAGYYGGSANKGSPLFKQPWNYSIGIGLLWKIHESAEKAPSFPMSP
ncbi:MAG: MipA/OmpV family protein [Alphaproteobacteria bacterium GM7ARS4]|nr:MipA/OmpV family protein [Alphaproteobacteria bacterium GM7ARS4]